MVYEIFLRKKNHQVIHELYKDIKKATKRFVELCNKFPEVSMDKVDRRDCCRSIKVI